MRIRPVAAWLFFWIVLCMEGLQAQDSATSQTIRIVSSFKPVWKPAAKLGFSASAIPPAPFSDPFVYRLPDQQYRVFMKSVDLVPAALTPDTLSLHNQHFLKLGYGNFQRIYTEAGTSWGTGKPWQLQLFAGHHSLKGNQLFQQNDKTYAQASVQYFKGDHIFYAHALAKQNNFFAYGNDALSLNDKKDSLRIPLHQGEVELGLRNDKPNAYGLTYDPSLKGQVLDARSSLEWNGLIRVPLSIRIRPQTSFTLHTTADLTGYRINRDTSYQNHIFSVTPALDFPLKDLGFHAGVQAAWDNGHLQILPQLGMEAFLKNNTLILIAGVQSDLRKNNFQSLITLNPWIAAPRFQKNTRTDSYFAGLRGTLPFPLSYRITGGITNFYQLPLYVKVPATSLFSVIHEARLETFHVKASAVWLHSSQLSAEFGMELYQVLKQKEEKKPWHFIPLQLHLTARWKPVRDLMLQADLFAWEGPAVQTDDPSKDKKLPAVLDASIEADFRISRWFQIWLRTNNLFNQTYQRWDQYPVLGLQLIGGIRLNFDPKK